MKKKLLAVRRPSAPMIVSTAALVVALGGTSYAAVQIGTKDIKDGAVTSAKVRDGAIRKVDLAPGAKTAGPRGPQGPAGADGTDGADGIGRWLLVDRSGQIVAQSGGFTVRTAYDLVNNSGASPVPAGALGNVYIDANEDLSDNAVAVSLALQNTYDQNGDAVVNGRAPGADANPEFSGEVTATVCGVTDVVACAPNGANTRSTFVVSPRMSDGSLTVSGADVDGGTGPNTHKRFYVVITGDSSDYVEPVPAVPAVPLP